MSSPSYPDATIAQAISYPGTDQQAATATGVPRRTVTRWRAQYRDDPAHFGPAVTRLVDGSLDTTLGLVQSARTAALREISRRVTDPKTRAGELAALYRELRDEAALLEGRATSRTELISEVGMDWQMVQNGRAWLEELEARYRDGGAEAVAGELQAIVEASHQLRLEAGSGDE